MTWIDAVAPEERHRTLATIRGRLSRRLGIPHPAVLELAPKAYLASLNDQAVQPETKTAADNFARRVGELRDELVKGRSLRISQRALEAASRLLESVDEVLVHQQIQLSADKRQLDDAVIADMGVLRALLLTQYRNALAARWPEAVNGLLRAAEKVVSGVDLEVREAIADCQTRAALTAFMETGLADLAFDRLNKIEILCGERQEQLATLLHAAADPIAEQLAAAYSQLLVLQGVPSAPSVPSFQMEMPSLELSPVQAQLTQARRRRSAATAVGAGIGTLMAPGLGTVVGAAAGRFIGSAFGPSSLGKMRCQAQAIAAQVIGVDWRNAVCGRLAGSLDRIRQDAEANVEASLSAFHLQYGAMIADLQEKHAAATRRVRSELEQAELSRRQLLSRRQTIDASRRQLLDQPFLAVESQ